VRYIIKEEKIKKQNENYTQKENEGKRFRVCDALPSPGVNPLEGSPKCSCGKRDSEGAPDFQL
jgi:hypothetical protein